MQLLVRVEQFSTCQHSYVVRMLLIIVSTVVRMLLIIVSTCMWLKNSVTGSACPNKPFARKTFTENLFSTLALQAFPKTNVRNGFYTPKNPINGWFCSIHSQMGAEQKFYALVSHNHENSMSCPRSPPRQPSWICYKTPYECTSAKNFIGMDISRFKY